MLHRIYAAVSCLDCHFHTFCCMQGRNLPYTETQSGNFYSIIKRKCVEYFPYTSYPPEILVYFLFIQNIWKPTGLPQNQDCSQPYVYYNPGKAPDSTPNKMILWFTPHKWQKCGITYSPISYSVCLCPANFIIHSCWFLYLPVLWYKWVFILAVISQNSADFCFYRWE